jgi:hypothetical protein
MQKAFIYYLYFIILTKYATKILVEVSIEVIPIFSAITNPITNVV